MDENFFAGAGVEEIDLPSGLRVELPVRYYDWTAIMAHFPAPVAKLRPLLPSRRLKPALLMPGTGVVSFAAFEYRDLAGVPPYKEFAISVPVQYEPSVNIPALPLLVPQWFETFGLYVHHLPVTTPEAYEFGVEIWGYPKFVAEISFENSEGRSRCMLRAEGRDIITLEVKKLATRPRPMDWYTYTVKQGQILKTRVQTQGQVGISTLRGGASYTLGDHAIAEELRSLSIGHRAVQCLYAPHVQSMLHAAAERLPL